MGSGTTSEDGRPVQEVSTFASRIFDWFRLMFWAQKPILTVVPPVLNELPPQVSAVTSELVVEPVPVPAVPVEEPVAAVEPVPVVEAVAAVEAVPVVEAVPAEEPVPEVVAAAEQEPLSPSSESTSLE